MKTQNYQGFKNYETWSVAFWLRADDYLNTEAQRFKKKGYQAFAAHISETEGDFTFTTPDRVAWNDPNLDVQTLDRVIKNF